MTYITLKGKVIGGNRIGRKIGFPTANIPVDEEAPVGDGVYAALTVCGGEVYEGMLNVGRKPTIGGNGKRSAEVYLFGFDGDLYGRAIEIKPLWFLRPEEKFDSIEDLRQRIEADAAEILKYFNNI
jgi:riboflavin kinase/FMN adenylyltransferase